ncbi:MAG: YbaK/EbsC family protein [Desulfotalea sp.]
MENFEHKLQQVIGTKNTNVEHLSFEQSCHSVAEAAEAVAGSPEDFVKNICMIDSNKNIIVAIVKGEDRASTSRVAKALGIDRPRTTTPDEILKYTGYPCGGTPSFGFPATFLIDPKVMEKEIIYSGGSVSSLVRLAPKDLLELNQGEVVRVRK